MSQSTLINDLDPRRIRRMPGQPRTYFDPVRLHALGESMLSYGQIMPGIVRQIPIDGDNHDHELLDGERRWRSALERGLPYRALLVEVDDEAAPYVVSVIANFNHAEHTTIEIADAVKVMMEELGLSQAEIGEAMGFHPVVISHFYGLRRLTSEVRDMLDPHLNPSKKTLPRTIAFQISHLPPEDQVIRAKEFMAGDITRSDLREHVLSSGAHPGSNAHKAEPAERWRSFQRRSEAIESKMGELLSLIRRTDIPEHYSSSSSVVNTKRVLQKVSKQLDEALDRLVTVRVPT